MRLPGVHAAAGVLLGMLPEPVRGLLPRPRVVRACPGGVRVELRVVGGPGTGRLARLLEDRLLAAGVERAEVNGALWSVYVACDPATTDVDKLVAIIEELDVQEPGEDDAGSAEGTAGSVAGAGFEEEKEAAGGREGRRPGNARVQEVLEVLDDIRSIEAAVGDDEDEREQGDGREDENGAGYGDGEEDGRTGAPRALDGVEQQARAAVSLGLHLLGAGAALAGQAARLPRLPPLAPALLSLVEHTPRVRRELEDRVGKPVVDAVLASGRILTHALALRPVSLLVDSVAAAGRYVDSRAGRAAWERREEEFAAGDGAYRHIRTAVPRRVAPLPRGPIEKYADVAGALALAGQGVTTFLSRDHQRGLTVLVAGVPKAARVGRDAFTSALIRALGRQDTIVLDRDALHRMDRVDTVILDAGLLTTGAWAVHGVAPLGAGVDLDELHTRLYTLIDLTDRSAPKARRERDGWSAAPYERSARADSTGREESTGRADSIGREESPGRDETAGPCESAGPAGPVGSVGSVGRGQGGSSGEFAGPGTGGSEEPAEVRRWREEGVRLVAIARQGVVVAVVGLEPEPHPLAEALVAAPGNACEVVLAGGDPRLAGRLGVKRVVRGGSRLASEVRAMQAEGHGVAVVSQRGRRALARADLGIGVLGRSRPVPWDADVIGGFEGAYLLLRCLPYARKAARRSVRVAGAAAATGAVLAFLGPARTALARVHLVSDAASVAALVTGEWTGRRAGREAPPPPADHTPWHAMTVQDVLSRLGTSPEGLPEDEAARRRGHATHGGAPKGRGDSGRTMAAGGVGGRRAVGGGGERAVANGGDGRGRTVAASGPRSLAHACLEEIANPLTPVLAAGAGVSAAVGSVLDAGLIVGVMAVGALLGGTQRWHADRTLHRLTSITATRVRLRRPPALDDTRRPPTPDTRRPPGPAPAPEAPAEAGPPPSPESPLALGPEHPLAPTPDAPTPAQGPAVEERGEVGVVAGVADDLVPGDVIELRAGDAVPADARVIDASGLEVDESTLTGESRLVAKSAAPTAAPAVADRTSMVYQGTTVAAGHGLAVVVAVGEATVAGRTARLAATASPPTGVELRLRALSRRILPVAIGSGVALMATELLRGAPTAAAVAPAVSLAVAAVPEGLPFVATVAELASAKRLSARDTLVRDPSTIEALGRVDVLCFDKTGTLTEGRISLGRVSDGRIERTVEDLTPELRAVVAAALRACPRCEDGHAIPHPTDRAVVEGAERLGVSPADGLVGWWRVDELPFEPARGYHAVLGTYGEEEGQAARQVLSVKGAPEALLDRCTGLRRGAETVALDAAARRELEEEVERLALQGYRVLAVAERPASSRADLDESRIERLSFLGFLGLADPVRPTAKRSVEGLIRAGVRVVMITGDHPSTAEAIAAEINAVNGGRVMTGPQLDEVDDGALDEVLSEVAVFARVTPEHKARIVAGLRRMGRVVAVTGDGANDVPAIRLADVGVALGSRATPAARAAADIVVVDERIETIIDAIVEGRAMWGSVRDSIGMLLGGNLGEIVFTLGSSLLTGRSALNTRQLLLVNLLTDMLPAMAVAVRPPGATDPDRLLTEGPEASLGAALTRDIYLRAVTTAAAATAAWLLGRMTGTRERADTIGLVGLVGAQLLQTLVVGGRDRLVLLASLASLAVLTVIVSVPGLSRLFGCRPIGPPGWGIGLGCAAVAVFVERVLERGPPPA
ncbi:HAD-IC family P-type ATPase [Nonomuraea sp. NPDC050691]|uniref:cation-translocating P-type ATPase n=1 Tax=Nonomuraea sp. NPDC050691 TaxID=3155661 RepID=UPI0033E8D7D9